MIEKYTVGQKPETKYSKTGKYAGAALGIALGAADIKNNSKVYMDTFDNSRLKNAPKALKIGIIAANAACMVLGTTVIGQAIGRGFEKIVDHVKNKNQNKAE